MNTQLTKREIAEQLAELVKNADRYKINDYRNKVDSLTVAYFAANS